MTKEEAGYIPNARFSVERCLACEAMNGYRCKILDTKVTPLGWCLNFRRVETPVSKHGEVPDKGEALDQFREERKLRSDD